LAGDGLNAGSYATQSRLLAFASIESLLGNTGKNTLDLSGYATEVIVTLTAMGSVHGFMGTATGLAVGFDNIDALLGTSATDTLKGANQNAAWALAAAPTYAASGEVLAFTSFETLVGGSANDTFLLVGPADFTGTVNGGVGAGVDTLDYSQGVLTANVVLQSIGSVKGFAGTASGLSGGFNNIDVLKGSGHTDTLTGADLVATFQLDGSDRYTYGANQIGFSGFEDLFGGALNDTFLINGALTYELNGAPERIPLFSARDVV